MTKKNNFNTFINELNNKPRKNYPTNKTKYNHIHETWSIDLADFLDYKTSNNKEFRYIFIRIDNVSKYDWAIPLKKNNKTVTDAFANIPSTSKRSQLK